MLTVLCSDTPANAETSPITSSREDLITRFHNFTSSVFHTRCLTPWYRNCTKGRAQHWTHSQPMERSCVMTQNGWTYQTLKVRRWCIRHGDWLQRSVTHALLQNASFLKTTRYITMGACFCILRRYSWRSKITTCMKNGLTNHSSSGRLSYCPNLTIATWSCNSDALTSPRLVTAEGQGTGLHRRGTNALDSMSVYSPNLSSLGYRYEDQRISDERMI